MRSWFELFGCSLILQEDPYAEFDCSLIDENCLKDMEEGFWNEFTDVSWMAYELLFMVQKDPDFFVAFLEEFMVTVTKKTDEDLLRYIIRLFC